MSKSIITLLDIGCGVDSVRFRFTVDGPARTMFWDNRELVIYCSEGVTSDLTELAGTFLIAMAPAAWIEAVRVTIPYQIPLNVKVMLRRMGQLLAAQYRWEPCDAFTGIRSTAVDRFPAPHIGLMFSGGVDSSAALLKLGEEVDWLIHLSNFENLDAQMTWGQRAAGPDTTRHVAHQRGLGWMHLRTNIASIFKHGRFDHAFPEGCSFWLGLEHVHHIVTALSALRLNLGRVYLAGGLNELTTAVGSVAANADFVAGYDPPVPLRMVDELVTRQDKIERLLDRGPELLRTLRVCYSSGDSTCVSCLKCRATAMMILSGGGRLSETSFPTGIHRSIDDVIAELSRVGPKGHGFFNQSLNGRCLSGTRAERWSQLSELVRADHFGA